MAERVVKCLLKMFPDETCAYVHISNACYLCVFGIGSWTEGFHEGNTSEEGSTCSCCMKTKVFDINSGFFKCTSLLDFNCSSFHHCLKNEFIYIFLSANNKF